MQGYVKAQYYLGVCHAKGISVSKDYLTAYAWLLLATESGNNDMNKLLDSVAQKLGDEDKIEAIRLSKEWRSVYQ